MLHRVCRDSADREPRSAGARRASPRSRAGSRSGSVVAEPFARSQRRRAAAHGLARRPRRRSGSARRRRPRAPRSPPPGSSIDVRLPRPAGAAPLVHVDAHDRLRAELRPLGMLPSHDRVERHGPHRRSSERVALPRNVVSPSNERFAGFGVRTATGPGRRAPVVPVSSPPRISGARRRGRRAEPRRRRRRRRGARGACTRSASWGRCYRRCEPADARVRPG